MVVMRGALDPSTLVLLALALILAAVAYVKDPGLPLVGAKNGVSMLKKLLSSIPMPSTSAASTSAIAYRLAKSLIPAELMRAMAPVVLLT